MWHLATVAKNLIAPVRFDRHLHNYENQTKFNIVD
jgi:hypothetical protein